MRLEELQGKIRAIVSAAFSAQALEEATEGITDGEAALLSASRLIKKVGPKEQEAIVLLLSRLNPPGLDRFLEGLLSRREISVEARARALVSLKGLGVKIPAQQEEAILRAKSWLSRALLVLVQLQEPEGLKEELVRLPIDIKSALIERLIKGEGEKSLSLLKEIFGADPQVDLAIVQALSQLPSPHSASYLLEILQRTGDKAIKRAVKKALYLLGIRGIPVKAVPRAEAQPIKVAEREEGWAISTGIDYLGGRLIWAARPRPLSGLYLFEATIRDTVGITAFATYETNRKGFRQFRERILGEEGWLTAEMDYEYACFLLEEAYNANMRSGNPAPAEYLEWRARLRPPSYGRALIYRLLDPSEADPEHLPIGSLNRALEIKELKGWLVEPHRLKDYLKRIEEINESRLVLSKEQKASIIEAVYEKGARELFDEELRRVYRRRLEEMAALFYLKGRRDDAKAALATALSLERDSPLLPVNPFALELVRRGMTYLMQLRRESVP